MKIISLIEKRYKCALGGHSADRMLADVVTLKEKNIGVILTENELTHPHPENADNAAVLCKNNRLKGMFDLGNIFPDTNVHLILYIFTKEDTVSFTVGEYQGKVIKEKIKPGQMIDWNKLYNESYYAYLKKIENWIESGEIESDEYAKFNTVVNELFEGVYAPKRYSETVYRVKSALENEKTVELSEIAEIIRPRPSKDKEKACIFSVPAWHYPIDFERLKEGILTDTPIRENDILFLDFDRIFFVDAKPDKDIYTSQLCYIIRPKNVSPYYLFMYLKSNTAKVIMQSLSMGCVLNRISIKDMNSIPVIMPSLSNDEYKDTFRLEYYIPKDISEFSRETRLVAYAQRIMKCFEDKKNTFTKGESVNDILDEEWAHNIRVHKTEVMQEFLNADIRELNACFRAKAYKATLILAGSILEAVLIDWLSEIKKINYFEEKYIVRKKQWDKKNECVKTDNNGNILYTFVEAGLADYINEIKELAKPKWMKAYEAHEIRKKRNLVHAKLCMADSQEINEKTCKEVIGYLKEVLETRGIHS